MTQVDTVPVYPRLPHPRWRVPLLGDIFTYKADAPSQSVLDYAAELGPVFEFTALGARYVFATGAEAIAELNDESRFCKHIGPDIAALRIIGGDGLFTAYNDEPNWHTAHSLLMPAFSQAAMRRYHPIMLDVAAQLTARWDASAGAEAVNVPADTTRVTFETIGRCGAGYSFGCFSSAATHPFIEHMVSGLIGADRAGVLAGSYLPRVLARRAERRVRRDASCLNRVADDIVARRRDEGLGHHDDLLELMLTPGPGGKPPLDQANVRNQLINFLIAGHETTSGALSFALYHLSRNPQILARARAEVDEVWAGVRHC